jgi:hypothetical protein
MIFFDDKKIDFCGKKWKTSEIRGCVPPCTSSWTYDNNDELFFFVLSLASFCLIYFWALWKTKYNNKLVRHTIKFSARIVVVPGSLCLSSSRYAHENVFIYRTAWVWYIHVIEREKKNSIANEIKIKMKRFFISYWCTLDYLKRNWAFTL